MHSIKTKHNINGYKFKPFLVSFMTAKKNFTEEGSKNNDQEIERKLKILKCN